MMGFLLVILVFGAMIAFEVPRLWRDRLWSDLVAFAIPWSVGFIYAVYILLDREAPSPVTWIEALFAPWLPIL